MININIKIHIYYIYTLHNIYYAHIYTHKIWHIDPIFSKRTS